MTRHIGVIPSVLLLALLLTACDGEKPAPSALLSPVRTEQTFFKDAEGRYLHFRGVNVSGETKIPVTLDVPLSNGRDFTYVGRPFPLNEADKWFAKIKDLGFNSIRLLFIWEAVFPDDRDTPDEEFLSYFESIIRKAHENDIYVLINMHENLFSRHLYANFNNAAPGKKGDIENILYALLPPYNDKVTGDGAPLWATKACLPEKNFDSPNWGTHHLVGALSKDSDGKFGPDLVRLLKDLYLADQNDLIDIGLPEGMDEMIDDVAAKLPGPFEINETCDLLPLSGWWDNVIVSLDLGKCYAALFAGDSVFPSRMMLKNAETGRWEQKKPEELPEGTVCRTLEDDRACSTALSKEPGTAPEICSKPDGAVCQTLGLYLQGSYRAAWIEVAKRSAKYPNVIGYDLMNEPAAAFYMLALVSAYMSVGLDGTVKNLLNTLLPIDLDLPDFLNLPWEPDFKGECDEKCGGAKTECNTGCQIDCPATCPGDEACKDLCEHNKTTCKDLCSRQETLCTEMCLDPDRDLISMKLYYLLKFLELLPPDTSEETKFKWGLHDIDFFGVFGLIDAFDVFQLQPMFQYVGEGIQQVYEAQRKTDPAITWDPIIWIEPTGSGSLQGETYMTKPDTIRQMVYTPHYYPDIYPWLGVNMPSRDFSVDEIQYRDFTNDLAASASKSAYTLSNIPVVFGEFGTYWNYMYKGDWETPGQIQSRANGYSISANFLDNYYESYEKLFMSNMIWCFSIVNDPDYGEGWNHEDFSILDENREPRGDKAWSRPYPRALSGKPVSMHFYSDYHYFEPVKGKPNPRREFQLVFESKETSAPTILFVPATQYEDPNDDLEEGVYVWLSDGYAVWDPAHRWLYYYPRNDDPDARHTITLRPPIPGQKLDGWSYFIRGDFILSGN